MMTSFFMPAGSDLSPLISTQLIMNDTTRQPEVTLEATEVPKLSILYIRDSVSMNDVGKTFQKGYAELFAFIQQNGLKPKGALAFYENFSDPITLEIAVEVEKLPKKVQGRISKKTFAGGKAVVAHYTGPYESLNLAYSSISQWLMDNNRKASGFPFESYLNAPDEVKDMFDLKTDVFQLIEE